MIDIARNKNRWLVIYEPTPDEPQYEATLAGNSTSIDEETEIKLYFRRGKY